MNTPDIADIIADVLKVSRGTAYVMMREALKEASPVEPDGTVFFPLGITRPTAEEVTRKPAPVLDTDGENRAVRSFLMLYGQPGLTVGQMRQHMDMSGFKSWPAWVETEPDRAHLTKAGAQLWIRHLFALEAVPPTANPWVGLTDDEIMDMYNEPRSDAEMIAFGRELEAKLKDKNYISK